MKVLDCRHPFHAGLGITCHASRLDGSISYLTLLHQSKGLYAKYGTKLFIFWKDFEKVCLEKDISLHARVKARSPLQSMLLGTIVLP